MGWKRVKHHYRIDHIVAFFDGEGLCIGSGYVHGLIVIDPETRKISHSPIARIDADDSDIARYWREIHSDRDTLWRLLDEPDVFEISLPVYTYRDGCVVEHQCEAFGWPNVTHDGLVMYENTFFENREDAREAGIRNAKAGVKIVSESIERAEKDMFERRALLEKYRSELASLMAA